MLVKLLPACEVCRSNQAIRVLKTSILQLQAELVAMWKNNKVIHLLHPTIVAIEEEVSPTSGWVVLDDYGKPTIVPSFSIYDDIWKRTFSINPMNMDWTLFDTRDAWDMDYLMRSIEVLEDQKDLWQAEMLGQQGFPLMISFVRYVGALKRLLLFAANDPI